jgi:hypothetical protein
VKEPDGAIRGGGGQGDGVGGLGRGVGWEHTGRRSCRGICEKTDYVTAWYKRSEGGSTSAGEARC